jgi:hypothetical protein
MSRHLKPCGTEAAWQRHRYRGEPVDEACEQAHRDYKRDWERAARTRTVELPSCTECGGERKPRQGAHGWCSACYNRWLDAGRPEDGPPPVGARATGQREDYLWLRSLGEIPAVAAKRTGVTEKTAQQWEVAA